MAQRADYAEAEMYLGRYLALDPKNTDARLGLALCRYGRGDLAAARELAEGVLAENPNHSGAALLLGSREAEAGRDAEAVRWLRVAEAGGADPQGVSYQLARVLRRTGPAAEADRYERRFVELRDAERAREAATRAAEREPANADRLAEVGRAYLALGQPDLAAQWFLKALSQDPSHRPIHAALADYYAPQPDPRAAARAEFPRARHGPTRPASHGGLDRVRARRSNRQNRRPPQISQAPPVGHAESLLVGIAQRLTIESWVSLRIARPFGHDARRETTMAQFYSLDEAAGRLGITPEEFKRRLKLEWTSIRPFRDGATLRFRAADIDELARSLGAASDPGLQLGPVGTAPAEEQGSSEFDFSPQGRSKPAKDRPDEPLNLALSDSELTLPAGDSGIIGATDKPKAKGDSDVRLDLTPGRQHDPEAAVPTEEISLDLGGPSSGVQKSPSSSKLSAPKSGTNLAGPGSGKIPGPAAGGPTENTDSSSEFELSLDADSDSFELQMASDSSEEVELGMIDSSPETGKSSQSGINLGKPSDTGVSLEGKKPKTGPLPSPAPGPADDSDVDFELSLDPSESGARLGTPKSGPKQSAPDSDSEFELTLDDNSGVVESLSEQLGKGGSGAAADQSKGDIFETDFDLPAMTDESGSEVVSVDAADTDLEATGFEVDLNDLDAPADDESASQVVLVDDAAAPLVAEGAEEDVLAGDDLDEGPSASRALRDVHRNEEVGALRTVPVAAAPAPWGALPAVVLFIALIPMFLGTLMSFEILKGMQGYHQGGKPSGTLARGIAEMFGSKIND